MPKIISLIAKLFGAGKRLSDLEKMILDCVQNHLDVCLRESWGRQIKAINKIQRLPEGVEVNFYRMNSGHPSFDEELAFPNKTTELLVAKVQVELSGIELNAKVRCVRGFVFSIEYSGGASYFEEALGMDPLPEFRLTCELMTDLASAYNYTSAFRTGSPKAWKAKNPMQKIKSLIAKLFVAGRRLSELEKMILNCVQNHLDVCLRESWSRQIKAINKIQRLPEGVEVNFYRIKSRRHSFDEELPFPNKTTELLVAKVQVELSGIELNAKVWCVRGFVFSIEYSGSVNYFEEALGMDPLPEIRLTCELMTDLAST